MIRLRKNNWTTVIGLALLVLFSQQPLSSQTGSDVFVHQFVKVDAVASNAPQACALLGTKGIPIGIEAVSVESSQARGEKSIRISSGTLKEILDSIVDQDRTFAWEVRDGVINVYPSRSRDDVLKSFLGVRLKNFPSAEMEISDISKFVHHSADLKAYLQSQRIELGTFMLTDTGSRDSVTSIGTTDADLRAILNRIVRNRSETKWWLIQRSANGGILLIF